VAAEGLGMNNLTEMQRDVLRYIMLQHRSKGNLPTMADISAHFKWKSNNAAQSHVKALRRKGYLAPKKPYKARMELPSQGVKS
jgi:repressor LexA